MKIICIGQNYINHIKELNNSIPENPVVFLKPDSAILRNNQAFYFPEFSNEIHHEVEIVVKINRLGKNISEKFASRYYNEITVGIDFTARDLQKQARENGMPWEISKAFDSSAPIGKFIEVSNIDNIENLNFKLLKNNELVQSGNTNEMIFSINKIISFISQYFTLKIGDLIYTGTPSGVGPIKIGDKLSAFIENQKLLEFIVK